MKKIVLTTVFLLISILFISGCTSNSIDINSIKNNTVVYGNYANGDYFLSFANPKTLKVNQKIKLTKGWSDNINVDKSNRIWIPIVSKDGSEPLDNRVLVINLKNKTKNEIKV